MKSSKKHFEACPRCRKEVIFNEDSTISFEDYAKTIPHDIHRCYNYKHFSGLLMDVEDDIQKLKTDIKHIQELMF